MEFSRDELIDLKNCVANSMIVYSDGNCVGIFDDTIIRFRNLYKKLEEDINNDSKM